MREQLSLPLHRVAAFAADVAWVSANGVFDFPVPRQLVGGRLPGLELTVVELRGVDHKVGGVRDLENRLNLHIPKLSLPLLGLQILLIMQFRLSGLMELLH